MDKNNVYTEMQRAQYESEADLMNQEDHQSHNNNPEYWGKLLSDLKDRSAWEGKIALDFGCGTGRNVRNLAKMGMREVHGCDLAEGNLVHARRRCAKEGIKNVHFWQTNGVGLGMAEDEPRECLYDFVMSTIVFQHIPVHSIRYQIWQEIYYALKNDGIFSFQMGFGPPQGPLPKASYYADDIDAVATNGQHDVWVECPNQIVDDLREIGFQVVTTQIGHSWEDSHPQWIYVRAMKYMNKPVSFVIQTWNREKMLHKCIDTLINQVYDGPIHVEVVDDQSTDKTRALVDHWIEISKMHPMGRSISYREGPGYSNFRPGGIFKSFFEHCLTSDAKYVGYQFSDDYSSYDRVMKQTLGMQTYDRKWSCGRRTWFVNEHEKLNRQVIHDFSRADQFYPAVGPSLPVYSMLFDRQAFIDVGGCDEPERAGLAAEAWIVAHAGLMGDPFMAEYTMYFREHPTNLGAIGNKGQDLYNRATAVTGMYEEDHWALWREIESVYNERVNHARRLYV